MLYFYLCPYQTETYQDDFEEERKARAAAAGERERLKLANKKLENENKRLKKEKRDLDTARKEQMGGGSLDGGNPACQSCTQLRKEVGTVRIYHRSRKFYMYMYHQLGWKFHFLS